MRPRISIRGFVRPSVRPYVTRMSRVIYGSKKSVYTPCKGRSFWSFHLSVCPAVCHTLFSVLGYSSGVRVRVRVRACACMYVCLCVRAYVYARRGRIYCLSTKLVLYQFVFLSVSVH